MEKDYRFERLTDSAFKRATDPTLGPWGADLGKTRTVRKKQDVNRAAYDVEYSTYEVTARASDGSGRTVWYDLGGSQRSPNDFTADRGRISSFEVRRAGEAANEYNQSVLRQFILAQSEGRKAADAGEAVFLGTLEGIVAAAVSGKEAADAAAADAARKAGYQRSKQRMPRVLAKMKAAGRGIGTPSAVAAAVAVAAEDATGQDVSVEQAEAMLQGGLDEATLQQLFPLPADPAVVSDAINAADVAIYNYFMQLKLRGRL